MEHAEARHVAGTDPPHHDLVMPRRVLRATELLDEVAAFVLERVIAGRHGTRFLAHPLGTEPSATADIKIWGSMASYRIVKARAALAQDWVRCIPPPPRALRE